MKRWRTAMIVAAVIVLAAVQAWVMGRILAGS